MVDAAAGEGAAKKLAPRRGDVLDRSRPFGTSYSSTGHPEKPFFQNGKWYDVHGNRIMTTGDKVEDKRIAAEELAQRKALAAKLKAKAEALEAGEDVDLEDETSGSVNLKQWAMGTANYRWALVRDAIQERYSRAVHNEDDARDFLMEMKLVTGTEVRAGQRSR